MDHYRLPFLVSLLIFFVLVDESIAQTGRASSEDIMREGITAFRAGRYEAAADAFEQVTDQDPDNAEAYFLLARVYAETPLEDRGRANRALDQALALEPNNVTFLVGRLQQLREESWNFFTEKIREQQRIDLAWKILELDSTNAFAHEELGVSYIRDFWRYRNAVMLPSVGFGGVAYRTRSVGIVEDDRRLHETIENGLVEPTGETMEPVVGQSAASFLASDPNEVFLADRFDVERLQKVGVPVQDLAGRAQRAYARAIGHLRHSLATDPRRSSVYDHLMEIYALKGEYTEALTMLEEMHAFYPEDARTWLYLGLAHYRSGNMDASSKSFETALSYMDEPVIAAFESLDYILPEDERRQMQDDPVAYASRYWTSKDPRYLTPYNERKLEHYARLVYADLLYGSSDLGLRGWETQRGRILVRYGQPDKDVVLIPGSTSQVGILGESGNRPTAPGEAEDMAYMNSSAPTESGMDMFEEANSFNVWDYGDFRFVFEDPFRNGEYRLYSPSASNIAQGELPWLNDYTIKARETFAKVPDLYEYEAPGRQIEIPYLVNAFRGTDDKADVYVHYGIPISSNGMSEETINITANVGTFLISDRRDILVEQRRTVYGLKSDYVRSFKDASLWVDTERIEAPSGSHQVSMEFETASGSTVAVQRREIDIPNFAGDELLLSDVLLAYGVEESSGDEPASGASIVRRGLLIDPAPWSVFAAEQPVYLYFEIYNLAEGPGGKTDYEMEATLTPKDDRKGVGGFIKNLLGRTEGVAVAVPGSGSFSEEGHYLILDASNQEVGLYTLRLRVKDNVSGHAVERQKELFLE